MRLNSELKIPETDNRTIHLSVFFELNGTKFNIEGVVVWKKDVGATTDYGVKFLTDESTKKALVEQLKVLSKNSQ